MSLITLSDDLRPEFSHSWSGSADYYHSFGRMQANILLEGFYTKLDDVFTLEKVGETSEGVILKERRNATGARVGGVTAELRLGVPSLFDVQLGYTYQRSLYVEPEQWSEDVEAQRTMYRSPDHYGYMSSNYYINDRFNCSLFGTFTGGMLVQHAAHTLPDGTERPDADAWTDSFLDMGFKCSYTLNLSELVKMEINAGVKNIFDAYQDDIDVGAGRDSAYIYGPAMPRTIFFGVKLFM